MAAENVTSPEAWTTASSAYQERIGRMTMHGTARIVEYINAMAPFQDDSLVLDVGTGAGSLPIKIKEQAPAATKILATDISPGMLKQVDSLTLPNVNTQIEDAVTLAGLKDNIFSHVFTSFAIQFTPDQAATVRQMYRVTKPGGIAGIVIWGDYTGLAEIHNRACRLIKPFFVPESPMAAHAWSGEAEHQRQIEAAGFKAVATECMAMPWHATSGEHYAEYWFNYKNPVPEKMIAAAEQQGIAREHLRSTIVKLVDDEYNGGKAVFCTAVLGWGTK